MRSRFDDVEPAVARSLKYEEKVVAELMKKARPNVSKWDLIEEAMAHHQTDRLALHWFHREYAGFPLRLGAKKIDWAFKLLADPFDDFHRSTPCLALFAFAFEQGIEILEQPVGLVFPAVRHRNLVIHTLSSNLDIAIPLDGRKPELQRYFLYRHPAGVSIVLESLDRFLLRIGDHWFRESTFVVL